MGCTSSKEAVQEPKKPFSHPPPTPHPNAHKHHQAHTDLIEEKNDSTQVKPEEIVQLPKEPKSVPKIEEPASSVPPTKPPTVTVTHTNNSTTTTSTATTSAVKRGSLRMIVEDTEEKFQMKSSNNSNPNIKKEDDSFQPYPGYVIKLRSLNPSYEYDKIFFNIFHHELFNSYPNEFILSKENYIIYDNRNKECLAYNILLPSNHFQLMESDSDEKEKTLLKLIYFINQKNPTARLENTSIKFPKTTKGYVGNDIPFFIIPMARKTSPKAISTATPTPTQAPTTVKLADIRAPTPPATVTTPEEEVKPVVAEVKTTPEEVVAPKGISIAAISKPLNVPVSSPPSPVTIAAPPKMVGWLRKRGHVVQNWKTRYFVLDNGFLTYYVDKLDLPPYGKTMKGQLCLAGYRDAAIIENGKINEEKQKEYEEQRLTFFSEGVNSKQAPQNRRKSTGMFTSEPLLRIHLMFIKGIVNEGNVEDLRNTFSQRNNSGKKGGEDEEGGGSGGSYEFMMEASNLEEKYAWLAAIEAHTAYIESVANSGNFSVEQFPYGDSDVMTSSNNNNTSDRQLSASPPQRPVGGSNSPSNLTPIGSFSVAPSESDRVKRSSVEVPMNANSGGGGGRRTSVINVSAVNQKWKIFIQKGEELVTNGLTGKPNPIGIQLIREIILVKSPAVTLSPEEAVLYPNSKRLIYIDANSFELKGEIKWIAGEKMPTIKKINDTCFDIIDAKNKSYRFYPKDEKTVDEWIEIINNTPPNQRAGPYTPSPNLSLHDTIIL